MNQLDKIQFLFLICIISRLIISFISFKFQNNKNVMIFLSVIYFILGTGLIYNFLVKTRKVGAFNNKVWWDNLRPIHSFLFLSFSYLAIYHQEHSWKPLFLDSIIVSIYYLYYKPSTLSKSQ